VGRFVTGLRRPREDGQKAERKMSTGVLSPTEQLRLLQSIAATPEQVLGAVGLLGRLPVDPCDVAKRLGVNCLEISSRDFADAGKSVVEGISHFRSEDATYWILFGREWHENARRFTVAHELGHVILHKDLLPLNRDRQTRLRLESAANRFAAGLLMPDSLIRRYATLPASLVAREFSVSPRAAEIRLASL
jgi:hypothetical protein